MVDSMKSRMMVTGKGVIYGNTYSLTSWRVGQATSCKSYSFHENCHGLECGALISPAM